MSNKLLSPFDLNRLPPNTDNHRDESGYEYPLKLISKLIIHSVKGEAGGTGFFIHPRVLLTAGHCVLESKGNYFSRIEVIPSLYGNEAPFGIYSSSTFIVADRFFKKPTFEWDFGFIILERNVDIGFFELVEDKVSQKRVNISGYPAVDKPDVNIKQDEQKFFKELHPIRRRKYQIHLTGSLFPGQSGSPLYYLDDSIAYASGVYNGSLPNLSVAVRVLNNNILREWGRIKSTL